VPGCCEHGDEPSDSAVGEFLDELSDALFALWPPFVVNFVDS
jgi:hypothetical protein